MSSLCFVTKSVLLLCVSSVLPTDPSFSEPYWCWRRNEVHVFNLLHDFCLEWRKNGQPALMIVCAMLLMTCPRVLLLNYSLAYFLLSRALSGIVWFYEFCCLWSCLQQSAITSHHSTLLVTGRSIIFPFASGKSGKQVDQIVQSTI